MQFKLFIIPFTVLITAQTTLSQCRYKEINDLPLEIFSYFANWNCYSSSRLELYVNQPLEVEYSTLYLNDRTFEVPGLRDDANIFIAFDFKNDFISKSVHDTFSSNDTFNRWLNCCQDAIKCCNDVMTNDVGDDNHCPSVWDGWSCFTSIPLGATVEKVCSKYSYGFQLPTCLQFTHKRCKPDGVWAETDSSGCDSAPQFIGRTKYNIALRSIALAIFLPGIILFLYRREFRKQRYKLILNLMIVEALRNILMILINSIVVMNELTKSRNTIMRKNGWPCRTLTSLEKLSAILVYISLLFYGIYLYESFDIIFHGGQRNEQRVIFYYILGALGAISSAVAWSVVMAVYSDGLCWLKNEASSYNWILDGPKIFALIVYCILLGLILHRYWHLFNSKDADRFSIFHSLKASLFCLPSFALPFIFLLLRPDIDNCGVEQFYYFLSYTVEAFQAMVAIFHCYTERKVKRIIRNSWKKVKMNCFEVVRCKRTKTNANNTHQDHSVQWSSANEQHTPDYFPHETTNSVFTS